MASQLSKVLLLSLIVTAFGFRPGFKEQSIRNVVPTTESQQRSSYQKTSPFLKAAVSILTDGLNIGLSYDEEKAGESVTKPRPRTLTPTMLKAKIKDDYNRAYFLTGSISLDAYAEDCVFTDPTISFSGLSTWSRNIANLKLFFRDPKLELQDIKLNSGKQTVETKWRLMTELALPWRPFIDVSGGTVHRYDLSRGGCKVVEHVESWDVSAWRAVLQIFKPGKNQGSFFGLLNSIMLPVSAGLTMGSATPLPGQDPQAAVVALVNAAEDRRQVADIPASGIIFKDSINVEAFKDPKVQGVTIYISDFRRPLAERITKDFFSDPSQASVACVATGPRIKMESIDMSKQGEEVFSEARGLLLKNIRVRRIYDPEAKALVYVSYSTRLSKDDDQNKSRFKSSLCAIPVGEQAETL